MTQKIEKDLITDFGNKIGGARKDDCKITRSEYEILTEKAQQEACTKQNIWKVNYKKMVKDGVNPIKVGWVKIIYEAIPKPEVWFKDERERFFDFVLTLKDIINRYLEMPMTEWESKIYCNVFDNNKFYEEVKEVGMYFVRNQRFRNACNTNKSEVVYYLLRKDLFLTPYQKAKLSTGMFYFDGENNKLETKGDEKWLVIKHGRSTSFRYSSIYENLKVGDYFLANSWYETMYEIVEDEKQKKLMKESISAPTLEKAWEKLEILCQTYAKANEIVESKKPKKSTNGKKRKVAFKPNITIDYENRRDCEYSYGKDFTGEDYLETFGFYGGEFGNWLNQDERQATLNCGYDSFMDLAYCLGVTPKTISLGGKLSIAFGARGKGGKGAFAAHYEPLYNVINLTKMRGAGCLAHEWGHAFDYYLSDNGMKNEVEAVKKLLIKKEITVHIKPYTPEEMLQKRRELCRQLVDRRFEVYYKPNANLYVGGKEFTALSDEQKEALKQAYVDAFTLNRAETSSKDFNERTNKLKETVIELTGTKDLWSKRLEYLYNSWEQVKSPEKEEDVQKLVNTDYYNDSCSFAEQYTAQGLGYWQDEVEMFARAFDQYVCENMGFKNLFLTSKDLVEAQPHPKGEEKQAIQEAMKKLIETACEKGLLEKFNYSSEDHLHEFYVK